MIESLLVNILIGVITILLGVLGWIGARVHNKLDSLGEKLEAGLKEMNRTLSGIERDLRGDLNDLDRRISHLEGKVQ